MNVEKEFEIQWRESQNIRKRIEGLMSLSQLGLVCPKRATLWHDESIVTAGGALYSALNVAQRYATITNQVSADIGDTFTQSFMLRSSGGSQNYSIYFLGVTNNNRGMITWSVDGVELIADQDWYSSSVVYNTVKSLENGLEISEAGYHTLEGEITSKNASSSGYYMVLTKIWIVPSSD